MNPDPLLPDPDSELPEEGAEPVPWSFKIMLALLAVYLLYRLWQGIVWLVERLG